METETKFQPGKMVLSENWDNEAKRVTKDDPDYKTINSKILQVEASMERHFYCTANTV